MKRLATLVLLAVTGTAAGQNLGIAQLKVGAKGKPAFSGKVIRIQLATV